MGHHHQHHNHKGNRDRPFLACCCCPCYVVSSTVSMLKRCLFVACFPVLQCFGLDEHRHQHHHHGHFKQFLSPEFIARNSQVH
ncbi:hypothetical protein RND71_030545 [Anisodus tanguticus]|uniref:Uncharacterized protein n=1 Tax=Anisodus tanguticus TaxID=243964 RepID=A0AAE1V145_9SOLA|nr:hypothetical protein RND71_030545 [Anisodus tanguticus]